MSCSAKTRLKVQRLLGDISSQAAVYDIPPPPALKAYHFLQTFTRPTPKLLLILSQVHAHVNI